MSGSPIIISTVGTQLEYSQVITISNNALQLEYFEPEQRTLTNLSVMYEYVPPPTSFTNISVMYEYGEPEEPMIAGMLLRGVGK